MEVIQFASNYQMFQNDLKIAMCVSFAHSPLLNNMGLCSVFEVINRCSESGGNNRIHYISDTDLQAYHRIITLSL